MSILIDPNGAIRIISDSDWPLESLRAHHGARAAYRVTGGRGSVVVEGRSGSERCVIERSFPALAGKIHRTVADGAEGSLEIARRRDNRSRIWWT